uniref:Synaptonemal complex protein 3-like n=1 Tax=Ciona intestinalis TaxID=7719 RepID=F6UXC1_CIOIN|nr:synaptonemal complex protein 3-like [Ciona intestinalis]|eukprot:XP_002125203.2 synaptonemal complex protein 3-like [Ciona intestinalis]
MPRKSKESKPTFEYEQDFMEGMESGSEPKEAIICEVKQPKKPKKRSSVEYEREESDYEEDEQPVASILNQFGSDIKKSISSKRRKLEAFTKQCCAAREKLDSVLENQKKDRSTLNEEYKKQISSVINQWETDIDKAKENEEKLNNLLTQQMKLITQVRVVQTQRFKSIKQLHDQYIKSVGTVNETHSQQHKDVNKEIDKELSNLQKKYLLESRNQEMATMRKSLHSMLYQ